MSREPFQEPPGFAGMSKAEQLRYLQELWDRVADAPGELPVPESHRTLLEERAAGYRAKPEATHPAYDTLERLACRACGAE